eukprot:1137442-Amphidinium_carterae.2
MKWQLWTVKTMKVLRRLTLPCVPKAKSGSALEYKRLHNSVSRSGVCPIERTTLPAGSELSIPVTRTLIPKKPAGTGNPLQVWRPSVGAVVSNRSRMD